MLVIIGIILSMLVMNGVFFVYCKVSIKNCDCNGNPYIVYNIMLIVLMFFLSIFISALFSIFLHQTVDGILGNIRFELLMNIAVFIIYIVVFISLIKHIKIRAVGLLELILEFCALLFEVFFVVYAIRMNGNSEKGDYVIFCVIIGVIFIYSVQLYGIHKLSNYNEMKAMIGMQKSQWNLLYLEYIDMEQMNLQQRKVLHDVKNHIRSLEGLMLGNNFKSMENYKAVLENRIDILEGKYKFNNKTLQVMVNSVNESCNLNNIEFTVHVRDVSLDFIDLYDLTTILGNIFDNALDRCKSIENKNERRMEFRLYQMGESIVFSLYNSAGAGMKEKERKKTFLKKRHYGIGLQNVKTAVEKYNGSMEWYYGDGEFAIRGAIPIPSER